MLDTIYVSALVAIDYLDYLNGWYYNPENVSKRKWLVLPNGATIRMEYYLFSRCLTLRFSASRVQNGTNAIAFDYEFNKVNEFKNTIEQVVFNELGIVLTCDDLLLTRLDINRDFTFQKETHANAVTMFQTICNLHQLSRRRCYCYKVVHRHLLGLLITYTHFVIFYFMGYENRVGYIVKFTTILSTFQVFLKSNKRDGRLCHTLF